MPRFIVEMERTQFFTAVVEAEDLEAAERYAEHLRPGFTPQGLSAHLVEIKEDDDDGWEVSVNPEDDVIFPEIM